MRNKRFNFPYNFVKGSALEFLFALGGSVGKFYRAISVPLIITENTFLIGNVNTFDTIFF